MYETSAEAFAHFLSICIREKATWFTTISLEGNPAWVSFTVILDSDWESGNKESTEELDDYANAPLDQ
jgi:hypothetical protein